MIVFAAIAPHGGPVFDEPEGPTRKGMEELGHRFASERPEAVIVVTPHGVHVDGHFAVVRSGQLEGDAAQWTDADTHYEGPGDPELADACVQSLQDGRPARARDHVRRDRGGIVDDAARLGRADPVVVHARARRGGEPMPGPDERRARSRRGGPRGRNSTSAGRADRERRPRPRPHGQRAVRLRAPNRPNTTSEILGIVRDNRLGALRAWDPGFAVAAKADSFWQLLMLHGALGDGFDVELLSYEAPTYFGMLTAAYTARPSLRRKD